MFSCHQACVPICRVPSWSVLCRGFVVGAVFHVAFGFLCILTYPRDLLWSCQVVAVCGFLVSGFFFVRGSLVICLCRCISLFALHFLNRFFIAWRSYLPHCVFAQPNRFGCLGEHCADICRNILVIGLCWVLKQGCVMWVSVCNSCTSICSGALVIYIWIASGNVFFVWQVSVVWGWLVIYRLFPKNNRMVLFLVFSKLRGSVPVVGSCWLKYHRTSS
jgi:hypothetical protein